MFNKRTNYMKRKSFLAKALLTLFAVLASFTGVRAETLTLYDGSETSTEIPANVFYFDEYTKSQFVIPAADLTALGTTPIRALTFYSSNLTAEYTTGSLVDVFLKEVEDATISDFVEKSGIVYSGTLSFSEEGELTIEFETPYNYSGGNLLVGFENTTADSFKNIK